MARVSANALIIGKCFPIAHVSVNLSVSTPLAQWAAMKFSSVPFSGNKTWIQTDV